MRGRFEMKPDLVRHFTYGRLHGGVISSVLDAMGPKSHLCSKVAAPKVHPGRWRRADRAAAAFGGGCPAVLGMVG